MVCCSFSANYHLFSLSEDSLIRGSLSERQGTCKSKVERKRGKHEFEPGKCRHCLISASVAPIFNPPRIHLLTPIATLTHSDRPNSINVLDGSAFNVTICEVLRLASQQEETLSNGPATVAMAP